MPRLNDLEVVDHELKDFRSRALDTLKALDEFEKLVSEYSELKQAYEAIQKNAAERIEDLDRHIGGIDQTWSVLETDTLNALEQINNAKLEHNQKFDKLQKDHDKRWTRSQEEFIRVQNDIQMAHQNLRNELLRSVNDLHGDSEQRFAEFNKNFDRLAARQAESIQHLRDQIGDIADSLVGLETSLMDHKNCIDNYKLKLDIMDGRIDKLSRRLILVTLLQLCVVAGVILFIIFIL